MPTFAEQLSAARKAAEMTQADLAAAVGVTRSTVSSWERGRTRPNLETLQLLSQALSFDFITGEMKIENTTGPKTDEETELPVTEPVSDVPPLPVPSAGKRWLPRIVCAVVLLTVCLAAIILPSLRSVKGKTPAPDVAPALLLLEEPALFTQEWFQGKNTQFDGEPYVRLTTTLSVDTTSLPFQQWIYSLIIEEMTGRPFKPERIDIYTFDTDVGYKHTWVNADVLWAAESGNAWRSDGMQRVSDMKGIGYIVSGYDEWGRKMSFRTYLDFTKAE